MQPSSSSSRRRRRSSRLLFVVVVAFLVLAAATATAAATTASSSFDRSNSIVESHDSVDNEALVVLPLLSHAFVKERYRRERRHRQRRELAEEGRRSLWWNNQQQQQDEAIVSSKNSHTQDDIWIPSESDIDPLYQGFGTHYVDLWVGCGDSPQRQTLVVDTGSSLTAFPCAHECIVTRQSEENGQYVDVNECDPYNRHVGTPYQEEESSCFRYVTCQAHHECTALPSPAANNACLNDDTTTTTSASSSAAANNGGGQCRISAAYLEGSSWSAVEAMDRVYTGGSHEHATTTSATENTFDLRFACQTSVTGLFQIQLSDGIMGMDRTPRSYWNQYFDSKKAQQNSNNGRQFALCLAKNPQLDRAGSGAGAMILGGTDPRMHKTPMAYAQLENDAQYFILWLEKMHLRLNGGHSVVPHSQQDDTSDDDSGIRYETLDILPMELNRGKLIIDSGTTATFFSKSLWEPFQQAYQRLTGTDFDTSERTMTKEELNAMPTILLQLSPAKLNGKNKNHHYHKKKNIKQQPPGVVAGSLDPDNAESILVALPPHRYMRYIEKRGTYAPEVQFSEAGAHHQVLGAYFLDGKMVHFDVTRRRVGFAESDCNYATGATTGRYRNETTAYPAFQNHPPPLHSYDEDEEEEYDAWYSPFEDSEDSESSSFSSSSGNALGNRKIRLVTTVLILILIAVCILAACMLRLIRRGRELRQLQRRQRRGGENSNTTQGGKGASSARRERQRSNNTSSRNQKKKNKQRERKLKREEEELNPYNADDLERMAMLDFPTLGENDEDDDDGLMFDRFRDEPTR